MNQVPYGIITSYKQSKMCLYDDVMQMVREYPNSIYSIFGRVQETGKIEKDFKDYNFVFKNGTTIAFHRQFQGPNIMRIHPIPQRLLIDIIMSEDDMKQLYENMKEFFGDESK